ncbi:uncharacterized protein LOC143377073 [Andrena cerasifolii]|uniref:uncharacterized protein LOC143377073 n=1 Tax=Andrena cerasifolii TaxID=2819439 RepID=UPI0040382342
MLAEPPPRSGNFMDLLTLQNEPMLLSSTCGPRLMSVIRECMGLETVATHLWSDSAIALDWIRGHSSRWKTYVANRVASIQHELPDAQWHHVSGLENPADCASRGLPPSRLPDFTLWWSGPSWLSSLSDWNRGSSVKRPLTDHEARVVTHVAASSDPIHGLESAMAPIPEKPKKRLSPADPGRIGRCPLTLDNPGTTPGVHSRRSTAGARPTTTEPHDRGTIFVGAERELRSFLPQLLTEDSGVRAHLSREGIDWRFNPPSAPHYGGTWEAAVKSVKHRLHRVIGEQKLTFEEMTTLLTQIEACLNSRPLQPLSDDPDDVSALTPGHFLIGDALLSVPDPPVDGMPATWLSRWQLIQQMRLHFWRRWSSEYIQHLLARNKWTQQHPPPRVGDLCLLRSELLSPAKWPLARVTQLHPGPDGLTRVVTIKTARTELQRPICKLVYLPFVQDDSATLPATTQHAT